MRTLRDAKVGDTVKVVKLHGEGATKRRIMDMGITKGVEIHVRKVAPLGDPMELSVRGYENDRDWMSWAPGPRPFRRGRFSGPVVRFF